MTTPIMLEIKTVGLIVSVQTVGFCLDNYPSVQTEIHIRYDFSFYNGMLQANSIWFDLDAVRNFYRNIKEIISGESTSATIESMSEEFSITFKRLELNAMLEVSFSKNLLNLAFSVKQHTEFDLVNKVYQQLSDFVREVNAFI